jgi:hypothetical protein
MAHQTTNPASTRRPTTRTRPARTGAWRGLYWRARGILAPSLNEKRNEGQNARESGSSDGHQDFRCVWCAVEIVHPARAGRHNKHSQDNPGQKSDGRRCIDPSRRLRQVTAIRGPTSSSLWSFLSHTRNRRCRVCTPRSDRIGYLNCIRSAEGRRRPKNIEFDLSFEPNDAIRNRPFNLQGCRAVSQCNQRPDSLTVGHR